MAEREVLVVGGGIAGVAACFAARAAGAAVTLVSFRPGATALSSGAVDDLPWDAAEAARSLLGCGPAAAALSPEVVRFAAALDCWDLPGAGERLPLYLTTGGNLRSARGGDRALLDLARLGDRTLLLPRVARAEWDAETLQRALRSRLPEQRVIIMESPVLRREDDERISDGDLAARHDDPARCDWLTARLTPFVAKLGAENVAVLLGPWLGVARERASTLSRSLGCPVGEVLHPLALAPGMRLQARLDACLREHQVRIIEDRVTEVQPTPNGAEVTFEHSDRRQVAGAVVLATGGLLGGGIVYHPAEVGASADGPGVSRPPFELSLRCETAKLFAAGLRGVSGGAFGVALETGWPEQGTPGLLEQVGLRVAEDGAVCRGIFACGDLLEARPRTLLAAVQSGLSAGRAAAAG